MEKSYSVIRLLRFPLAFAVVMIHCRGSIDGGIHWDSMTGMDAYYLLKVALSGVLFAVAVPAFFFISGFLFFRNVKQMDSGTYTRKLRSRLRSLLIPYVAWNLLCIPLMLLYMYGETLTGTRTQEELTAFIHNERWGHIFWDFISKDAPFDNLLGWTQMKSNPVLFTFWYVRDLMVMTLLSPAIFWYVRKTGWAGFVLAVAVYVLRLWPYIPIYPSCLFFVFGAYWSLNGLPLAVQGKVRRRLLYSLTLCLGLLQVRLLGDETYWGAQLYPAFMAAACFTVFCLADAVLRRHPGIREPVLLTESSFFVYALHVEFAVPFAFFMGKCVFMHTGHPLLLSLQYLFTGVAAYGICVAAYAAMQWLMPKGLSLLCGQRT
jgi:fucose 4-O-acetylase-like acetyltransferase